MAQDLLSDVDAHLYVISKRIDEVVQALVELLGASLVAHIGGVKETRAVAQWTRGRTPQRESELRCALQIAAMIATLREGHLAKAWFEASNPHLDDKTPIAIFRDGEMAQYQRRMMHAARTFAARD
jgi:hypothetical protein